MYNLKHQTQCDHKMGQSTHNSETFTHQKEDLSSRRFQGSCESKKKTNQAKKSTAEEGSETNHLTANQEGEGADPEKV